MYQRVQSHCRIVFAKDFHGPLLHLVMASLAREESLAEASSPAHWLALAADPGRRRRRPNQSSKRLIPRHALSPVVT